jgi:UDP-4-amino-4,6-dideoxy-N-acetyl-beta-L-altrosamine transaminase
MIPYGRHSISVEDEQAVLNVLRGDFLTQGPAVDEFEKNFAKYVGAKYAVAVSNGTAALHLCALALNVGSGDRVLVATNTFCASANCIRYCGGEVEFVDIAADSYCIDLSILESKIKSKPKGHYRGVVVVDFAGYPVNLEAVNEIIRDHEMWIIEDSCHAPGGAFRDSSGNYQKCGNGKWADLAIFSFHPVKHIAAGEGGMVTTNNLELYNKLRILRTHGITKDPSQLKSNQGGWWYEMQELGYNYRMPDILCALGNSQLQRAEERLQKRKNIAAYYNRELSNVACQLPVVEESVEHAYHLYIVQLNNRKKVYDFLREAQIFTQVHYIPVHKQPYYVNRYGDASLEVAEKFYERALSLPMFPELTQEQLDFVIKKLKECL